MKIATNVYVIRSSTGEIEKYSVKVFDEYYNKTTYAVGGNDVMKKEFDSFMKKWCRLSPARAERITAARFRAERMAILEQRQKFYLSPLERTVRDNFQSYIDQMSSSVSGN